MNHLQRFEQHFNQPSPPALSQNGRGGSQMMHVPRRVQAIQGLAQWKSAGHDQPDWWLRLEIGGAFQQLVCLALPGTPAVEMLPATSEMWWMLLSDMNLDEETDRPRIRQAFKLLYTSLKEWPQLADLIEKLPPRPQKAAAPPPRTEQQHADGAARLKDILDGLGKEREDGNDSA